MLFVLLGNCDVARWQWRTVYILWRTVYILWRTVQICDVVVLFRFQLIFHAFSSFLDVMDVKRDTPANKQHTDTWHGSTAQGKFLLYGGCGGPDKDRCVGGWKVEVCLVCHHFASSSSCSFRDNWKSLGSNVDLPSWQDISVALLKILPKYSSAACCRCSAASVDKIRPPWMFCRTSLARLAKRVLGIMKAVSRVFWRIDFRATAPVDLFTSFFVLACVCFPVLMQATFFVDCCGMIILASGFLSKGMFFVSRQEHKWTNG